MVLHGTEYPFGDLRSVVSAVSLPRTFPTISLLAMEAVGKTESHDTTHDLFRNSQNTGLLSTLHYRVFYQEHPSWPELVQYIEKKTTTKKKTHWKHDSYFSYTNIYTKIHRLLYLTVKTPWDKNIKYRDRDTLFFFFLSQCILNWEVAQFAINEAQEFRNYEFLTLATSLVSVFNFFPSCCYL